MKRYSVGIVLVVLSFFFVETTRAWAGEMEAISLAAQADLLYPDREEASQMVKALALYTQAIAASTPTVTVLWKASRAAWWAGTRSTDREDQLGYFRQGIAFGQEAIARGPDCGEAHFWLGGNYGSYGHARGVLSSLFLVPKVRREMAETIRLTPSYLGGGAYRLLGIMEYKIPAFAGGSKKRAAEDFAKALEIDANNPITTFYHAEYLSVIGQRDAAAVELRRLDGMTVPEDEQPELRLIHKERQKLALKLEVL